MDNLTSDDHQAAPDKVSETPKDASSIRGPPAAWQDPALQLAPRFSTRLTRTVTSLLSSLRDPRTGRSALTAEEDVFPCRRDNWRFPRMPPTRNSAVGSALFLQHALGYRVCVVVSGWLGVWQTVARDK